MSIGFNDPKCKQFMNNMNKVWTTTKTAKCRLFNSWNMVAIRRRLDWKWFQSRGVSRLSLLSGHTLFALQIVLDFGFAKKALDPHNLWKGWRNFRFYGDETVSIPKKLHGIRRCRRQKRLTKLLILWWRICFNTNNLDQNFWLFVLCSCLYFSCD